MPTRYQIVEEGHGVYVRAGVPFLWWHLWYWDKVYALFSGGQERQNYGSVEEAQKSIDARVRMDARSVDPPRVTDYPAPNQLNKEAIRQQELEAARRRSHDYGPRH